MEFNREFQDIYLDREMSKADAAKELAEIQQSFTEFMERNRMNPKKTHPDLTRPQAHQVIFDHSGMTTHPACHSTP